MKSSHIGLSCGHVCVCLLGERLSWMPFFYWIARCDTCFFTSRIRMLLCAIISWKPMHYFHFTAHSYQALNFHNVGIFKECCQWASEACAEISLPCRNLIYLSMYSQRDCLMTSFVLLLYKLHATGTMLKHGIRDNLNLCSWATSATKLHSFL